MPSYFWAQRQDIGPSPRVDHGLAYDSARSRLIIFGGDPGATPPLGDTWSWDGSYWTQVADMGPSPRYGHSLSDFPPRQRLVLFGGAAGAALHGDTWAFDDNAWVQVGDTGPSPRVFHSAAYDVARSVIVLFGGNGGGSAHGDTWTWDGQDWTQVQDVGPSPRSRHAMAYDSDRNQVILFGGADSSGAVLRDTWAWDGSAWTQIADTGPEPRAGVSIAGTSPILLFGGVSSVDTTASVPPVVYGDTWEWTTQGWTKVQDIGPSPRYGHGAGHRTDAGRIALFGGASRYGNPATPPSDSAVLNDTWEVSLPGGGSGGGTSRVVSVSVSPSFISVPQPQPQAPDEIAAIEVVMSSPPPAGHTLTVDVLPSQSAGALVFRARAPAFDGHQSTITFPLVYRGPGMMLQGMFGVSVSYGTGGVPVIAQFEIHTYDLPAISGLSPSYGSMRGGTEVIISGSGFTGATAVTFDGTTAAAFTVNSDSSITATSPAHSGVGPIDAQVLAPGGQSAVGPEGEFTYGIVDFTISDGTGSGPWNSSDDPVLGWVGDVVRFHNADNAPHRLHADSAGAHWASDLAPGGTFDWPLTQTCTLTDVLYDHDYGTGARFYIVVDLPS